MDKRVDSASGRDGARVDRREFLTGAALAAGAAGALAGGLPAPARAAAPPAAGGSGASQPPPLKDVAGKVAYVTGASSGIGLGCARVLREAGMKVVIGYIDEAQVAEALAFFEAGDPDVHTIRHDVTDVDGWTRTADEIDRKYGRTHLLVNNAGVGLQARAVTGTPNDWQWGMGVNFWGVVHGAQTFVPRMRAHGEGSHIVTISSIAGVLPGSGAGIYTVSKAAVAALMEELRVELQDTNIGTSVCFPAFTASNIAQSERYRPEELRNENAAPPRPPGAAAGAAAASVAPRPGPAQMDPLELAQCILDGIRHNDLFIFSHPEWKPGVQMRADAMMASFLDRPVPTARVPADPLRSPLYAREVAHRRATANRPFAKG